MTTSGQLTDAMKGVSGFLGVFPVDTLPRPLKAGQSCIVNLQPSDEAGSHWVCCSRQTAHPVYIDPFGAEPDDRVKTWLGGHPVVSIGDYQGLRSQQCGEFCVYLLRHLAEHGDLYRALYNDLVPDGNNEKRVKDFWLRIQKNSTMAGKGIADSAYCLKCKAKKAIKGAHATTMKNGRHAVCGTCSSCGTKVSRIVAGTKGSGLFLA